MGDGRRRRRRKNAQKKPAPVAKIDAVADDMLKMVFMRLPLPLHLVRAACTCRRWRRIIAADDCHVIRSLHGAPSSHVIGHYRVDDDPLYNSRPPGPNPVFVPSNFASPWTDILPTTNLTLDFLPQPELSGFWWELADIRGGLLLLLLFENIFCSEPRLIICDPRIRRYRSIPRSACFHGCNLLGAFLLNSEATGVGISLSNFRVTCVLNRNGIARACSFSSVGGGWTSGATGSTAICGSDYWTAMGHISFAGSTEASAYWTVRDSVLALDKEAAELSLSVLSGAYLGEPHGPTYAYELPWPPVIRACLF